MLITKAEAIAAAANYYTWGADGISLWNVGIHFGNEKTAAPEQQERIHAWTQAVRDPQAVWSGPPDLPLSADGERHGHAEATGSKLSLVRRRLQPAWPTQ